MSKTPVKLDLYDKKILTYAAHDIRTPLSQIAKELRISPARVHYKLERLKRELITPTLVMNIPALQVPVYLLTFTAISAQAREVVERSPQTWLSMRSIGRIEFTLIVVTDDLSTFCHSHLPHERFEVQQIIAFHPDEYDAFQLNLELPAIPRVERKTPMNSTDYRVLCHFAQKPEQSYREAANESGIDRTTIKRHVNELIHSDIIMRFRLSFNPIHIGRGNYFVYAHSTPSLKRKLRAIIDSDIYSGFVFETATGYVFWHMPENQEQLFAITERLRAVDPLASIDIVQNTAEQYVNTSPPSLLNELERRAKALL